jgi:hypothetical protein
MRGPSNVQRVLCDFRCWWPCLAAQTFCQRFHCLAYNLLSVCLCICRRQPSRRPRHTALISRASQRIALATGTPCYSESEPRVTPNARRSIRNAHASSVALVTLMVTQTGKPRSSVGLATPWESSTACRYPYRIQQRPTGGRNGCVGHPRVPAELLSEPWGVNEVFRGPRPGLESLTALLMGRSLPVKGHVKVKQLVKTDSDCAAHLSLLPCGLA